MLNIGGRSIVTVGIVPMISDLRNYRLPNLEEMTDGLTAATSILKLRKTVKALKLDKHEKLHTLVSIFDKDSYVEALISVIGTMIPIFEDSMIGNILENGDLQIIPETLGINRFGAEDLYDVLCNPEGTFTPDESLEVFLAALDFVPGDDAWAECNEYFGWYVPDCPQIDLETEFDRKRMFRKLRAAGMAPFIGAMDVAMGMSNTFFSYRPYDGIDDTVEFTTQNVRMLIREKKDADRKLADLEMAQAMADEDIGYYQKFADIWVSSFVPKKKGETNDRQ